MSWCYYTCVYCILFRYSLHCSSLQSPPTFHLSNCLPCFRDIRRLVFFQLLLSRLRNVLWHDAQKWSKLPAAAQLATIFALQKGVGHKSSTTKVKKACWTLEPNHSIGYNLHSPRGAYGARVKPWNSRNPAGLEKKTPLRALGASQAGSKVKSVLITRWFTGLDPVLFNPTFFMSKSSGAYKTDRKPVALLTPITSMFHCTTDHLFIIPY